jgi:hypothetical protein
MKRIDINNSKFEQPHFIGSWNIENNDLCKKIIDFFEENKSLQILGVTDRGLNLNIKNTTEIRVSPNNLKDTKFKCLNDYIAELYKCYVDYQDQWPFLKNIIQNVDIGSFNIQKYSPGGHYSKIHTERSGLSNLHRMLVWMIYLNDVDDGGSTNFSHYDIKVKPEIGKTLIWPAEWTHAHSGETLNSGFKYIVTGWMHFPHNN